MASHGRSLQNAQVEIAGPSSPLFLSFASIRRYVLRMTPGRQINQGTMKQKLVRWLAVKQHCREACKTAMKCIAMMRNSHLSSRISCLAEHLRALIEANPEGEERSDHHVPDLAPAISTSEAPLVLSHRSAAYFVIATPTSYASARASAATQLLLKLVHDSLNETTYMADIAGLEYAVSCLEG